MKELELLTKTVKQLHEDFSLFLSNDFHDLKERVRKLSGKIIWIMGIYTVLNGIIWILIMVLASVK